MLTGAAKRGERQQVGEVLLGERDQVLHQHVLGGGQQSAFQQCPPVLQQVVPAECHHLPVSDITLGAPAQAPQGAGYDYQYTCLSFEINATNATVYATEALGSTGWFVTASNCMGGGSPPALATSLSGGGQSGTPIEVLRGTAVTDTAMLSGPNASTATGMVTYDVYSDSACTVAAPGGAGEPEKITPPGTLPTSSPVTLTTPGTYYWQASYSGDANNAPSTSTCGTEVETVTPYCGSAKVGYQAANAPGFGWIGSWAGYVAESSQACTFKSVTGQWAQPACPDQYKGEALWTSFWVGLDGQPLPSQSVEQTGINAYCYWIPGFGYLPSYEAWYELAPNHPVYYKYGFDKLHPQPGSQVKATVTYDGNGKYTLSLTVTPIGGPTQSASAPQQPCPTATICENKTAEWVLENHTVIVFGPGMAFAPPWFLTNGTATTAANPTIEQTVASFQPVTDVIKNSSVYACPDHLNGSSFDVKLNMCPG
jgi:hypothetical protein